MVAARFRVNLEAVHVVFINETKERVDCHNSYA